MTTRSRSRSSSEYSSNYNNQEQNSDAQQINYTKEQPDHCAENHLEKFQESLEKVDVNVAADVRNEKNLLKYKPEERLKHMETYVEAFNDTDQQLVQGFKDRKQTATDITKSTFKHVYNDFEALEANNAEKVPEDLKRIFKKEGITDFRFNEETGNIEFDFKEMRQPECVDMRSKRQTHVLRTAAADRTTSTNSAARRQQGQKARKRHRLAPSRGGPQRRRRGAGGIQERDRQIDGTRQQEPDGGRTQSRYDESIKQREKHSTVCPRQ